MQDPTTPHRIISVQFKTDESLTSGGFQLAFSDHGGGVTETSEGKVEITEADVPDPQKEPYMSLIKSSVRCLCSPVPLL